VGLIAAAGFPFCFLGALRGDTWNRTLVCETCGDILLRVWRKEWGTGRREKPNVCDKTLKGPRSVNYIGIPLKLIRLTNVW